MLEALRPVLLVIDCDPPLRHDVQFFNRLRTQLPKSRVLIVAAENADEFKAGQGSPPALEFIKKPFELATFGAAVQRLLARDAPAFGTLRHLRLLDMVLLHAITGANVLLRVEATGNRSGEIHFSEGRIVHAAVMGKAGKDALRTMLGWRAARFSEGERTSDAPHTIHGEWPEILREILPDVAPIFEPAEPTPPAAKRKIVVVDDTELLLHFVEGSFAVAHSDWEIVTANTGFDGLKAVAAENPDLLLLDYNLPDITGGDVCEKLLENDKTTRVPVVMMSGHVSEMMKTAARFENIVATIAKPFVSAALIELIEQKLSETSTTSAPFAKKSAPPTAPAIEEKTRSRNGPPPIAPVTEIPQSPGLAEEEIPASILDPSPATEEEITEAAETSQKIEVHQTLTPQIPAGIKNARSNAVVLGLPLEVRTVDFSAQLRVKEIRARPVSSNVWLHVLPQQVPPGLRQDRPFRLSHVQLNRDGQLDIHVAPVTPGENFVPPRYRLTIDVVELLLADNSDTIRLAPTTVAPIRLELLALFELCGVELSPQFRVQRLALKMRDPRVRATFLPEAIHIGATLRIAELSLNSSGTIDELRLIPA